MRLICSLFFIQLLVSSVSAQINIKGTVLDETDQKQVGYANITLLRQDSSFVKGEVADNEGRFKLNNISKGDYLLKIASLGYETSYIDLYNLNKDVNINNILLNTKSTILNSVTVIASRTTQKVDRKIILPSESQVRASNNGISLLQNLQLSRLSVNPITKSITTSSGGNVQLCINGVKATKEELNAILPKDIIRIEYYDEPTMRYNDAAAVIDYIVKRKESGGSFSTDLSNAISNVGVSDNSLSAKYNYKRSEFGINTSWTHRKVNWTRENIDSYIYPDKHIQRREEGNPTRYLDNALNLSLNYNLYEADKYMFSATFRNSFSDIPDEFTNRTGTIYTLDNAMPLKVKDFSSQRSNAPSLDLYFQRKLKNDQSLTFNLVGTYINTDVSRNYTESIEDNILTNINSDISGSKYSLITEGIYEKSWKSSKLSGGLKHTQSYTENKYKGDIEDIVGLNFAETYMYLQYIRRYGKFNYTLGLGGVRVYNSQGENSSTKYIFRPILRVMYNIRDGIYIRYSGSVTGNPPSLADLNNVEQLIDSLQIRRGNPNLKSSISYSNGIATGFNKGKLGVELYAGYRYTKDPIMEEVLLEKDKFIRTNANHQSFHWLYLQMPIKFRPYKNYLTFSITPGFNRYISNGNNYIHTYNNYFVRASLLANYKNCSLYADMNSRYNNLWGETISRGERIHSIRLGYNTESWNIGIGMINPFSKYYSQDSKNLSSLTPSFSKVESKNMGRIFMINFSYNIQFGKRRQSINQTIQNNDSDKGILSGSK